MIESMAECLLGLVFSALILVVGACILGASFAALRAVTCKSESRVRRVERYPRFRRGSNWAG